MLPAVRQPAGNCRQIKLGLGLLLGPSASQAPAPHLLTFFGGSRFLSPRCDPCLSSSVKLEETMDTMEVAGRILQTIEKNDIFPPFAKYDGLTSFFGGVP